MNLHLFWYFEVFLCLALSFLFSGMESGVLALNRLRLRQKNRAGDRRAGLLLSYLEKRENFLWTIFIGNALSNFMAVCLVVMAMHNRLGEAPAQFWLAFAGFVLLLYVLGDLLPKMLFQTFPNRLCLALAVPYQFVHLALAPVVGLLNWLTHILLRWTGGKSYADRLFSTREELRLVMQESSQGLSSEERSMINRVLDFQKLTVGHITIPFDRVLTVNANTRMTEVLRICRTRGFTRVPVVAMESGRRRIMGLVSLKSLLYHADFSPEKTAAEYVMPALFLSEDLSLESALRRMQRGGHRLALVLGRDRREVGVLSLQDILRALFGEVSL
jgi:CBS domain containing-hemolysin-like protein